MKVRALVLLVALVMLSVLFLVPGTAKAATEQPSFSLSVVNQPKGYYIVSSKGGDIIQEQVKVTNTGTISGKALVIPTNATTDNVGGLSYPNATPKGIGSWIVLPKEEVLLAPKESKIIDFSIHVPSTVQAGVHTGGVAVEYAVGQPDKGKPSPNSATININFTVRVAIAVEVDIPGSSVYKLSASDVSSDAKPGLQQVLTTLTNSSNQFLKPFGTVQISQSGKLLDTQKVTIGTFLPGDTIKFPVVIGKGLNPGTYTEHIVLSYGDKGQYTLNYTKDFTVTDSQVTTVKSQGPSGTTFTSDPNTTWYIVLLTLGIVLVISGITALVVLLVYRRRHPKTKVGKLHHALPM